MYTCNSCYVSVYMNDAKLPYSMKGVRQCPKLSMITITNQKRDTCMKLKTNHTLHIYYRYIAIVGAYLMDAGGWCPSQWSPATGRFSANRQCWSEARPRPAPARAPSSGPRSPHALLWLVSLMLWEEKGGHLLLTGHRFNPGHGVWLQGTEYGGEQAEERGDQSVISCSCRSCCELP